VNATDEEMKRSIANYFNPMDLMDAPTDQRGILDPQEDARPPASGDHQGRTAGDTPMGADAPGDKGTAAGGGNVEKGNRNRMASAGVESETDRAAFHDPYAALASSAADIAPEDPVSVDVPLSTLGERGVTAESEDTRDPFDPAYWQTVSPRPAHTLRPGAPERAPEQAPDAGLDAADRRPTEEPADGGIEDAAPPADQSRGGEAPTTVDGADTAAAASPDEPANDSGPPSPAAEAVFAAFDDADKDTAGSGRKSATVRDPGDASEKGGVSDPVADAAEAIRQALSGLRADVEVTSGETSVLIALTDDRAFSMFPIGSANPTEDAMTLFDRVAGALAGRPGSIVIRGHTDARPFAKGTSDNWVLSFERAHATKTALVDNGITERRIARVEGLADREPTMPDDPLADENRRIEILYEPAAEEAQQ
jgi:chemotaxis protein MotB